VCDDAVRYDPVTDTLRAELRPWPGGSAADPAVGGEDAAGDLVVHYAPDGRPWAWEIDHAARHTELVGEALRTLRAMRGLLDAT
jgi:uncharacterized protein YuzE